MCYIQKRVADFIGSFGSLDMYQNWSGVTVSCTCDKWQKVAQLAHMVSSCEQYLKAVIGEIFGHINRLRSQCLQVQPANC